MSDMADGDAILASLRESFIESATDKLNDLDDMLEGFISGASPDEAKFGQFKGEVHTLKGLGGTFGFPIVSVICHRLEEFILDERAYSSDEYEQVQVFLDQMRQVIETGDNPDESQTEALLAALPSALAAPKTIPAGDGCRVVLVNPMAAIRKLASFYISEYGCDVIETDDAIEGFRLCVEIRPDYLITSIEMENLNGIDLGRAVAATQKLTTTRVALLTGSSDAGAVWDGIPPGFLRIRTEHLEDDIAQIFENMVE